MSSSIEWTDETWNPTVGCSEVSPGCDNCYAARVAHRGMTSSHAGLTALIEGKGIRWNGKVRTMDDRLGQPFRWRQPRRVFVDSMSDLFHREVPRDFLLEVWLTMALTPRHTYQVLTKRPRRMRALVPERAEVETALSLAQVTGHVAWERPDYAIDDEGWLPNVWLGTSIEQDRFVGRADYLRVTPAALRFLSLEPLLGPLPHLNLAGIGWVIVGGESGPGARPLNLDWLRTIRDQCAEAGVPFFVKQLGRHQAKALGMSEAKGHVLSEFPDDLQIREVPHVR